MRFKPTVINIGNFKANALDSSTISLQKADLQRIVIKYKFTHGWGEQSDVIAPALGEINVILDDDLIDHESVKKRSF